MGVLGLGIEEKPTHGACTRLHEAWLAGMAFT